MGAWTTIEKSLESPESKRRRIWWQGALLAARRPLWLADFTRIWSYKQSLSLREFTKINQSNSIESLSLSTFYNFYVFVLFHLFSASISNRFHCSPGCRQIAAADSVVNVFGTGGYQFKAEHRVQAFRPMPSHCEVAEKKPVRYAHLKNVKHRQSIRLLESLLLATWKRF